MNNRIFLLPGELTIAMDNTEVKTILGSCVSIILHSPLKCVSAINHAQQPAQGTGAECKITCAHPCGNAEIHDHKYVTCSFDFMWERLKEMGISPHELEVSLFGGSTSKSMVGSPFSVGDKNIATAEAAISKHGLRIHHRDVGGTHSRKLIHFTKTGITQVNN